jgi:hypothetical protein
MDLRNQFRFTLRADPMRKYPDLRDSPGESLVAPAGGPEELATSQEN